MPKTGDKINSLGFGMMRLPGKLGKIDQAQATKLVAHALNQGVNYFDTAYLYPGSEEATGAAIEALGCRKDVYIATKLPLFVLKNLNDAKKIFEQHFKRLKTDYIDYYLLHNISSYEQYTQIADMGVVDFLVAEMSQGRIRRLGFSYHGNRSDFKRILDARDWDFCQIQLNYLDEEFQAGVEGLAYAKEKGVGVVVMEPLRGGLLANSVPKDALTEISKLEIVQRASNTIAPTAPTTNSNSTSNTTSNANATPTSTTPATATTSTSESAATNQQGAHTLLAQRESRTYTPTPAQLALRWVLNNDGVICALSGMRAIEELDSNAQAAMDLEPGGMCADEVNAVEYAKKLFNEKIKVLCTGCGYCLPCPHKVNIPLAFAQYNNKHVTRSINATAMYITSLLTGGRREGASSCVGCHLCEKKCPQSLPIADLMPMVKKDMEKPYLVYPVRFALHVMKAFRR
jgi:predicted aldo/keto reductase-like oxidoreductase